jgi:hypothetical protein
MTADAWDTPIARAWIEHVLTDMLPKMEDSAIVCSIMPSGEGDVKFWVELGASIMLDKPIVIVAFENRDVPAKLRRVADEVVICPEGVNPEASQELVDALRRVLGE